MPSFKLLLVFILFVSCTDSEDRLSYGITKHKAEKQLTKSAVELKEDPKACISSNTAEEVRLIEIKRKDREYSIVNNGDLNIQRLEIRHRSPGTTLGFKWESSNFPSKFAQLVLDSDTSCFFLEDLDIKQKGNIKLFLERSSHISDVTASFTKTETLKNCDYQKVFGKIQKAFAESKDEFTDEARFLTFVKALIPSLKRGGCKRKFDSNPVPMWWLCGHFDDTGCSENDPVMWFRYLTDQRTRFSVADKLMKSRAFVDSLDEKTSAELQ